MEQIEGQSKQKESLKLLCKAKQAADSKIKKIAQISFMKVQQVENKREVEEISRDIPVTPYGAQDPRALKAIKPNQDKIEEKEAEWDRIQNKLQGAIKSKAALD